MDAKMQAIADALEDAVFESKDRVAVAIETGEDESFFVGTRDSFIRLAAALFRAATLESKERSQLPNGVSVRWSTETHGTHDPHGAIAVSAECCVDSDGDRKRVVEYFAAGDG